MIVADATIAPFVPAARVVPVLGLGTTFGLTVSGVALLLLVRRECGSAALRGAPRAFLAGLAGCVVAAAAGSALASAMSGSLLSAAAAGLSRSIGISALLSVVVTGVFAVVVLSLDGGDLRTALSRLRAGPFPAP